MPTASFSRWDRMGTTKHRIFSGEMILFTTVENTESYITLRPLIHLAQCSWHQLTGALQDFKQCHPCAPSTWQWTSAYEAHYPPQSKETCLRFLKDGATSALKRKGWYTESQEGSTTTSIDFQFHRPQNKCGFFLGEVKNKAIEVRLNTSFLTLLQEPPWSICKSSILSGNER